MLDREFDRAFEALPGEEEVAGQKTGFYPTMKGYWRSPLFVAAARSASASTAFRRASSLSRNKATN